MDGGGLEHRRLAPVGSRDPGGELIGDLERSALCDQLSNAFATGRLRDDELDQRLALAVTARTRGQAQWLVRDLGTEAPPAPALVSAQPRSTWTSADLLLTLLLVGCVLAVVVMLLASAVVSPPWFFCAVVGGTFAFTAGASATQLLNRSGRRGQQGSSTG